MSTTDIQKKLKAAIARRLKELDVYVEDELPDYVMVMVANKKEKKAMRSDLSLFLGANTDTFVDWLFDVMTKLHSAGVSGKTEILEKKTEIKPVPQNTRDPSPSRNKEKLKEKERKAKEERERVEREKERKERERRHKEEQEKAERKAKKEREEKLEEERKRNKEKELRRLEKEREEREKEREREKQQREAEERSRHEERHHKRHRNHRERSNTWSDDENGVRPRYRVASVVEKLDSEQPMPTVSSRIVVKRKPQPVNDTKSARGATSILQRAVAAANQSANNKNNQTSTLKRPRITSRVDYGSESEPRTDDDEQNNEEAMMMAAVGAAQSKATSSSSAPTKFIITMKQSQHPRNVQKRHIKEEDEKEDVAMEPTKDKRPRHMRISAPDETYVPLPKYVEKKKTLVAPNFSQIKPLAQSSPKKERERLHAPIQWDGQIKLDPESSDDDEARIDAVLASTRRIIASARSAVNHGRDGEESDEELPPTALLSRGHHKNKKVQEIKKRGIKEEIMGNSYSGNYSPVQTPTEAIAVYVPTPIQKAPSPGGSSPIAMDSMMQYTIGTSPQNHVNKANGKCKYWPNCTRGFSCGFVHPSKACSAFPNCTFGSSCLYIHPVCRFNTQCKNTSCSFTHSATGIFPAAVLALSSQSSYNRPSAIVTPMMKPMSANNAYQENSQDYATEVIAAPKVPTMPCMYGAACTNSRCTFKHPPACKFGYSCYNPSCAFYHAPTQQLPQSTAAPAAPIQAHRQSQYTWKAN